MVAMGKSIMSRELEVARNWRSLLQLDLEYYIKFILNFDKYFPEKKLIIRPHPAENEKFWIELTKNLKMFLQSVIVKVQILDFSI